MKAYIGTTNINAKPMSRKEYNDLRGWDLPSDENGNDKGYLVETIYNSSIKPNTPYFKGYVSWLPAQVFERIYKEATEKTLSNTDVNGARANVKDMVVFGDGDTFQLICKASSKNEGWMKSTKAMQIDGVGCVVQVTTQQGDNVSEAVCFVPGVRIAAIDADVRNGRKLVAIDDYI